MCCSKYLNFMEHRLSSTTSTWTLKYPYINIKVLIQFYSFSRVQDHAVVYKMTMCECEALCVVSGHHEAALTIESLGPISEVCFIAGRGA